MSITERRCFDLHRVGFCISAVPAFPRIGCLELDWSRLGINGNFKTLNVVREMLIQKLKVERKWKASSAHLNKPELLKKVLNYVNRSEF